MVLRQIADGPARLGFPRVPPENFGGAGGRVRAGEQHFDERGLARAVGPEQSIGGSARHAQRKLVDGQQFTRLLDGRATGLRKNFSQTLGFNRVVGHAGPG